MADLRLLLSVLIFTAATTLSVAEDWENVTYNYHLPDDVMPVHYNIKLISRIEEGNFTFDGESTIVVKILRTTRTLSLHALDLTIDRAATTLISSNGNNYTPKHHIYDTLRSILAIRFDNELPPNIYHLNLKFVGVLADNFNGFYRTSYYSNTIRDTNTTEYRWSRRWLAATNFHPTSARRAFPCWDEPALKTTFNISIKHHQNYTALSNMPMRKQTDERNENGMIWTHFETTPIMSTYQVAFVVFDFVRCSDANDTITMWCSSRFEPQELAKRTMQEVAAKAGQFLTTYTNNSNKISKWDHVWIPFEIDFKKEAHVITLGLTTYSSNFWPITEEPLFIVKYVTNAMTQQWIGCVVSPLWWTEKWLNDGLVEFFSYYILDQTFPDRRIMDIYEVVFSQYAIFFDDNADVNRPITSKVQEINSPPEIASLFQNWYSYGTSRTVSNYLRMIRHICSKDVFQKGIIKYLHAHQFGSAASDDLWKALQEALDESDVPHDDYKVKDVMDTWLKGNHFPVVRVTRNYENGDVILTQEHFRLKKSFSKNDIDHIDNKWWIPISFATKSNPDFSNTLPTHWLKPQDQNVTIKGIDPNDWIIVNLQAMGYYRVMYDLDNWLKLSQYLDSDDYEKIHVLNRVQIITDAKYFRDANQLNLTTFLDVAKFLRREKYHIDWWYPNSILEIIYAMTQGRTTEFSLYRFSESYTDMSTQSNLESKLENLS